jgi:OmpA-OmpF porin, OOP family
MKAMTLAAASLASLAAALPAACLAQSSESGVRLPYERGFWGHAGASVGRARLDAMCPGTNECDRSQNAWKLFAGGRFNNILGGEFTYLRAENFKRGGGDTDVQLANFSLMAGVPLGVNSSLFGKAGAFWGHTEVTGTNPELQTGTINGWGPSLGVGAQVGLTKNWALRLDLDRYRPKFPGNNAGHSNLDTLMVGAQYSFGAR